MNEDLTDLPAPRAISEPITLKMPARAKSHKYLRWFVILVTAGISITTASLYLWSETEKEQSSRSSQVSARNVEIPDFPNPAPITNWESLFLSEEKPVFEEAPRIPNNQTGTVNDPVIPEADLLIDDFGDLDDLDFDLNF